MILGAAQSRVAHVFVTTELMRQEGPKVKVIFGYIVNLRPCHMQTTTSTPQKYCVSLGLSFSVCYVGWSLISCVAKRWSPEGRPSAWSLKTVPPGYMWS